LPAREAFIRIKQYKIALVSTLDGRIWLAGVEIKGEGRHNKARGVRSVSAQAASPLLAIELLIERLDSEANQNQWELMYG